jgi:hypothetical protein
MKERAIGSIRETTGNQIPENCSSHPTVRLTTTEVRNIECSGLELLNETALNLFGARESQWKRYHQQARQSIQQTAVAAATVRGPRWDGLPIPRPDLLARPTPVTGRAPGSPWAMPRIRRYVSPRFEYRERRTASTTPTITTPDTEVKVRAQREMTSLRGGGPRPGWPSQAAEGKGERRHFSEHPAVVVRRSAHGVQDVVVG